MRMLVLIAIVGTLAVQAANAADGFATLRVSSPLIASASAGLRLGQDPTEMRPTLQAEVGVGGGRLMLGLDNTGEGRFGLGLKASALRTWLEPINVDEDQTFLGLEGEVSLWKLVVSVGGYMRASDGDDDWLLTVGLGFVF